MVHAAAAKGRPLRNPHAYGVLEAQAPGQRAFRLDVSLDFPQVPCFATIHSKLSGAALINYRPAAAAFRPNCIVLQDQCRDLSSEIFSPIKKL